MRGPPEFETTEDEAGPFIAGVSSSHPHKLPVRRPRAPSPVETETSGSDEDNLGLGEDERSSPPW